MDYKEALDQLRYEIEEEGHCSFIEDEMKVAFKALEKQIPKKPVITIDGFFNGQPIYGTWGCPNCGKVNETDFEDYKYCPICGQALDWSDENA